LVSPTPLSAHPSPPSLPSTPTPNAQPIACLMRRCPRDAICEQLCVALSTSRISIGARQAEMEGFVTYG
jgi:hypothetical protein